MILDPTGWVCHVMSVISRPKNSDLEKQRHERYQKLTDSETQAGWAEKMAQLEKDRAEKDHRRAELQRDEDVEL